MMFSGLGVLIHFQFRILSVYNEVFGTDPLEVEGHL